MGQSRSASGRRRPSGKRESTDLNGIPYHHGSHDSLLDDIDLGEVTLATSANVDAVVVPTNRYANSLGDAMRVAEDLGRPLLALCSGAAQASEVVLLGKQLNTQVIAIDSGSFQALPILTGLLTTARPPAEPEFARRSDLSLKRNAALLLARLAGWEGVFFLDDDIWEVQARDVRVAAGLLEKYAVVGLRNDDKEGYPDNSVVCHAFRKVKGRQSSFVGAGAAIAAPAKLTSFFPDIYNEDWFVFHDVLPVARTGRVVHRAFDPFASPARACAEEFGDCLGEGLFWLQDQDEKDGYLSLDFWRFFLSRRRSFIQVVLDRLQQQRGDDEKRNRMIASVTAARESSASVTAPLCLRYVTAWRRDIDRWQEHLAKLPTGLPIDDALRWLCPDGGWERSW